MSSQAAQAVAPSGASGSSASAGPSTQQHQHQSSTGAPIPRAHSATPITSGTQHTSPGSPRHQGGIIDIEALIRSHGGDVRRTLEVVLGERNSLQAQNTQLWKLIEKQRAQCAHLAGDNGRLRADRERANSRLIAAGLEPVTTGTRRGVTHSSSAMTLASTTTSESHGPSVTSGTSNQAPRRQGSDQEDKAPISAPAVVTTAPKPAAVDAIASSAERSGSPSGLLPSPMPEKRLRHESRMTFPPEVASFMALADTKEQSHPPGNLAPYGADGSHSSSPGDSQRASPIMEQEELVQGDSPRPSQDTVTSRPSTSPIGAPDSRPSIESTTVISPVAPPQPDHTQLTPALLPHARLSIPHSTVFPNQSGRDVLCFIVAVTVRPPNSTTPLSWTVGKTFSAFMELDTRAQERSGKSRKDWKRMVSPLPEGKAWKDFAPSKIDQRKASLEQYLQSLLVAPVSDKSDLCAFLSTDVVQAKSNRLRKEGYLTKKGKNFGGWKTRYFVLDGPVMKYYEARGGAFLGSIQVVGAQIGRQNRSPDASDDRNFRHAFLIIEANGKKDSSQNRHVLCASSDIERDSWIDMLVRQVEPEPTPAIAPPQNGPPNAMSAGLGHQRRRSAIRKPSKDVVVTSAQPMSQLPDANAKFISGAPLPSVINLMESQRLHHTSSNASIQGQTQPAPTQPPVAAPSVHVTPTVASSTNDLLLPSEPTPKPLKRQSAMPARQSFSPAYLTKLSSDGVSSVPGYNTDRERDRKAKSGRFWGFGKAPEKGAARPVFGVPLADSILIASVAGLPAIVFRCIEYLEAKHADQEEGIYRLSGSSAVIKGLKERFNQEGDVNLLQIDERWDPHAIAGLLKTYLRELPTSLLTRTLHMRFLAVIDLVDSTARVTELSRLVAELPPANYTLLRAFTAHLILIVKNSAVNKMTLRNIGIVFSPTLGIPAGIFYELVSRFGAIFDDEGVDELPLDEATVAVAPETGVSPSGTSNNLDDPAAPINKRNSVLYHASGADAMLGLAGRALDPSAEDSQSELSLDDVESEPMSAQSSDNISLAAGGPEVAPHNTATIRRRDVVREGVEALQSHNGSPG